MTDLTWLDRIACKGMDPQLFYPHSTDRRQTAAAKAVCARCPVRPQCEEFRGNAVVGVWAGTSSADRKAKPLAVKPKLQPKPHLAVRYDVTEGRNKVELVKPIRNERGAA